MSGDNGAKELGHVGFTFGGLKRTAKCTMRHALQIEEATGRGVIELTNRARNAQLTINEIAVVLRIALESSGQGGYSHDDIIDLMPHEGVAACAGAAAMVLVALITTAKPKPKSGNGKAVGISQQTTSPPQTT